MLKARNGIPAFPQRKRQLCKFARVAGEPRFRPQFLRNAFRRFQDRVKVVVLEQLGTTEFQNLGMHAASHKFAPQLSRPLLGLRKCRRRSAVPELTVGPQLKAAKNQNVIERRPALLKHFRPAREADGPHGFQHEFDHLVAAAILPLPVIEGSKEPFPLGDSRFGVVDPQRAQKSTDLCCLESSPSVGEHLAETFEMAMGKRWMRRHGFKKSPVPWLGRVGIRLAYFMAFVVHRGPLLINTAAEQIPKHDKNRSIDHTRSINEQPNGWKRHPILV